jgi:hypothetical protein
MNKKHDVISTRYLYPKITLRENEKKPNNLREHLLGIFNGYIINEDIEIIFEYPHLISTGKFYYLKIKVENTHINNDIILRRFRSDRYFIMNSINYPQSILKWS